MRRTLARVLLRLARWKTVGELPTKGIIVGAPHTSNWDWYFSILFAWSQRRSIKILIKKEFFKGPLSPLFKATGGVPLDRKNPAADIKKLLADIGPDSPFLLTLAAEGTRDKVDYWKSGFYRISQQTGLPIVLAYIDGAQRIVGAGPTLTPSGNLKEDMDFVRAFYADKPGIRPEKRTEPRLRDESPVAE